MPHNSATNPANGTQNTDFHLFYKLQTKWTDNVEHWIVEMNTILKTVGLLNSPIRVS
jgi:hypothetical protein